jgi:hypothetical protein
LSVIRSTRFVCGGDPTGRECCSSPWSVGWLRPTFQRVAFWPRVCAIACNDGLGARP